jgi:hypothetical protein
MEKMRSIAESLAFDVIYGDRVDFEKFARKCIDAGAPTQTELVRLSNDVIKSLSDLTKHRKLTAEEVTAGADLANKTENDLVAIRDETLASATVRYESMLRKIASNAVFNTTPTDSALTELKTQMCEALDDAYRNVTYWHQPLQPLEAYTPKEWFNETRDNLVDAHKRASNEYSAALAASETAKHLKLKFFGETSDATN